MLFHKYDPVSKIYIETVELEIQPDNSVAGDLPDLTEFYTLAYIDDTWTSVLRPELDIINGEIVSKVYLP